MKASLMSEIVKVIRKPTYPC